VSAPRRRARFRAGLLNAFADPALADHRRYLYLKGIDVLPPEAYRRIREARAAAERYGFRQMD
jgi:hypothetical protein